MCNCWEKGGLAGTPEKGDHAECSSSIGERGSIICHHESLAGLDITAQWELLTPDDEPVPEPENEDPSLHPPTKLEGSLNPKYAMKETFVRGSFTGTTEKMCYAFIKESPIAPPKKRARWLRK